jgi:hypothetical protein
MGDLGILRGASNHPDNRFRRGCSVENRSVNNRREELTTIFGKN